MSRPVGNQKLQDGRKHATNQRAEQPSTLAHEPPPQHNLSDLIRYTLGYSTFEPIEDMGLPGHLQELVGDRARHSATVGSAQLIRATNGQHAKPRTKSSTARGSDARYGEDGTRPPRTQVQTPSQTNSSVCRGVTSTSSTGADTPLSRSSLSSPPQDSISSGPSATGKTRSGRESGSGSRQAERIVCWR